MKKYILVACLLTSLFSLTADKGKYHTWFIFNACMNTSRFESESTIEIVKSIAGEIGGEEKSAIVLARGEFLHKGSPSTRLTSLTSKGIVIFCSTIRDAKEVHVDIYTDKMNFDRHDIGEFCRKNFEAHGYGMAYTTPD